ncbi:MAG TPA: NYN domain-containing protein, partial [Candidatus Paceibacterota bacterium]
ATGDGDFIPLVEYVKSQGCQVEAITFGRSASSRLRETVDDFIDMDENPAQFLIGYKPAGRQNGKQNGRRKENTAAKKRVSQKVVGTDTDDM